MASAGTEPYWIRRHFDRALATGAAGRNRRIRSWVRASDFSRFAVYKKRYRILGPTKNRIGVAKSPTFFKFADFCKFIFRASLLFASLRTKLSKKAQKPPKLHSRRENGYILLYSYSYKNYIGPASVPSSHARRFPVVLQLPCAWSNIVAAFQVVVWQKAPSPSTVCVYPSSAWERIP